MTRLLALLLLLVPTLAWGANIDQVNLAKDSNFLLRVQYVIVNSAVNVRAEATPSVATREPQASEARLRRSARARC